VPYLTVFRDRAPEDLILAWCARAAAAESKSIFVPALTARLEVGGLEGEHEYESGGRGLRPLLGV
jgi:hypothetical protein